MKALGPMKELEPGFYKNYATTLARLWLELHDRKALLDIYKEAKYLYRYFIEDLEEFYTLTDGQRERALESIHDELTHYVLCYFEEETPFSPELRAAMRFDLLVEEMIDNISYHDIKPLPTFPDKVERIEIPVKTPKREILHISKRFKTPSDPGGLVGNGTSGLAASPLH